MVDLYELKLMSTDADNYNWPVNIDEHVAQLDFEASIMASQSVFGSVLADPTSISTDSLDMETLRARCENNKQNDYKLTFEDSGQWTTSGIGGSFTTTTNTTASPPTPQTRRVLKLLSKNRLIDRDNCNLSLHFLEELNNKTEHGETTEKGIETMRWKDTMLDEIFNNNNNKNNNGSLSVGGQFTTWGRIGTVSTEMEQQLPFDSDKVNSVPELNRSNQESRDKSKCFTKGNSSPTIVQFQGVYSNDNPTQLNTGTTERPLSLMSNFFKQQLKPKFVENINEQPPSPMDYEYSEVYLGNGRYIDMNDNEIGFVPFYEQKLSQASNGVNHIDLQNQLHQQKREELKELETSKTPLKTCRRSASAMTGLLSIPKSPRTFADLSNSQTEPDLKFIALSHKVPSISHISSDSYENLLKRAREGNFDSILECCANSEKILFEQQQQECDIPDSGFCSSLSEGPSHIEDWPSLSFLLPRHVVQTCSFFKINSFLLTSSSNNIERRCQPRSFTASGIRRLNKSEQRQRPNTACCNILYDGNRNKLVEFSKSAVIGQQQTIQFPRHSVQKMRLHAKELTLIGLPVYDQKRNLVERVVEGVAEIIRGASSVVLMTALQRILSDGLKPQIFPWKVIHALTGPGPITASVFQLILELEASEKPENSRVTHFFQGLARLHSADGWFSYIVMKEHILRQFYTESAFLLGAQTNYRSLFLRFVECLELLSVLNQCSATIGRNYQKKKLQQQNIFVSSSFEYAPSASRLPNDSRVPKSSSVPTKLSNHNTEDIININEKVENPDKVLPSEERGLSLKSRPSRIPILRSRSNSNRVHRPSLMPKRSPRICQARETMEQYNGRQKGTMLPAKKGEFFKVISVRGPYSRCSRLKSDIAGKANLAIRNGIMPTEKLKFFDDDDEVK